MKHHFKKWTPCSLCKSQIEWPRGMMFEQAVKVQEDEKFIATYTFYTPPIFLCDEHIVWRSENIQGLAFRDMWPGPETVKSLRIRSEENKLYERERASR